MRKLSRLTIASAMAFGILAASASPGIAQTNVPEVVRVEGSAQVRDAAGVSQGAVRVGTKLSPGGTVETGENGRVVVKLGSTGFAVLDHKSKLEVAPPKESAGLLRQITGWIYYAIRPDAKRKDPVTVRTTVATIGIRGTRFLVVDVPGRSELGMRKGLVSVESLEGAFELHRLAEKDEFEAYKQQGSAAVGKEKKEFEKFEAATKTDFAQYTREFSLGADRQAIFDGKQVREQALSAEAKREMESAEGFGAAWLETVKD
jgi:ferric-dicitrate binding protein FerR (iron transport regulator)